MASEEADASMLAESGVGFENVSFAGTDDLVIEAMKGNVDEVRRAIEESELHVDSIDSEGTTALTAACFGTWSEDVPMVDVAALIQFLLDSGADVCMPNATSNWIPLFAAVFSTQYLPLALLVGHMAPDVMARRGDTRALAALTFGHIDAQDMTALQHFEANLRECETCLNIGFQCEDQKLAHDDVKKHAEDQGLPWTDADTTGFIERTDEDFPDAVTYAQLISRLRTMGEVWAAAVGTDLDGLLADTNAAMTRTVLPVARWIDNIGGPAKAILCEKAGLTSGAQPGRLHDPMPAPTQQRMAEVTGRAEALGSSRVTMSAMKRKPSAVIMLPPSVAKRIAAKRATSAFGASLGPDRGGSAHRKTGRVTSELTGLDNPAGEVRGMQVGPGLDPVDLVEPRQLTFGEGGGREDERVSDERDGGHGFAQLRQRLEAAGSAGIGSALLAGSRAAVPALGFVAPPAPGPQAGGARSRPSASGTLRPGPGGLRVQRVAASSAEAEAVWIIVPLAYLLLLASWQYLEWTW